MKRKKQNTKTEDCQLNDLSRKQTVLLYTFASLEKLIDYGMVEGPKRLTGSGRLMAKKLLESDFVPTNDETDWAMNEIFNEG